MSVLFKNFFLGAGMRSNLGFWLTIALLSSSIVHSQTNNFDLNRAKQVLKTATKQAQKKYLNFEDLKNTEDTLENLIGRANLCVKEAQQNLKDIEEIFQEGYLEKNNRNEDYLFLAQKKAKFKKRASDCRLFVFRSQDTLTSIRETLKNISTVSLMRAEDSILSLLFDPSVYNFSWVNWEEMIAESGIFQLHWLQWITLLILLLAATTLLFIFKAKIINQIGKFYIKPQTNQKNEAKTIFKLFFLFTLFAITCAFFFTIFSLPEPLPVIVVLALVGLSQTSYLIMAKTIYYAAKPRASKRNLARLKILFKRGFKLLSFYAAAIIIFVTFKGQYIPKKDVIFASSFFFISHITLLCVLARPFSRSKHKFFTRLTTFWEVFIFSFFPLVILIDVAGFHQLAKFLASAVILSIVSGIFLWAAIKVMDGMFRALDQGKNKFSVKFRYFLGIRPRRSIDELLLLRVAFYIIAFFFFTEALIKIWTRELIFSDFYLDALSKGFSIGGLKIIPSRIVAAIIIFAVLHLGVRFVASSIAKRAQVVEGKETQVALASIVSYVGFSILIFLTLLIAGADFTGIAIIVGALSVGIGLGLQDIVNNFISGLILLIEKPVKPGDRIRVGNVEGFVKKIRIRSTQIHTMAKEDVIVPNSELVSSQVINYMYCDELWRISCAVGVAYGSDIKAVKEAMIDVAIAHEKVLKEKDNYPSVYFTNFGESSLNFELWCVIKNVNEKYQVIHDLNCAINKEFEERKIAIAFPQLDIHVKNDLDPKSAIKKPITSP